VVLAAEIAIHSLPLDRAKGQVAALYDEDHKLVRRCGVSR